MSIKTKFKINQIKHASLYKQMHFNYLLLALTFGSASRGLPSALMRLYFSRTWLLFRVNRSWSFSSVVTLSQHLQLVHHYIL